MLKRCAFRERRKEGRESISLMLSGRLFLLLKQFDVNNIIENIAEMKARKV